MKAARVLAGLTQGALGIAAGIDEGGAAVRINRYEKAVHTPDLSTATNIANALNVPCAYFYCESDELAEMLLAFHRASKVARKTALDLLSQTKPRANAAMAGNKKGSVVD